MSNTFEEFELPDLSDCEENDENEDDDDRDIFSEDEISENESEASLSDDETDNEDEYWKWIKNGEFSPEILDFDDENSGVTEDFKVQKEDTSFSMLQKFLTEEIMEEIVAQSNLYVEQKCRQNKNSFKSWKSLNRDELWRFFALHLLTGIVRKTCVKDYWSTNPVLETPIFSKSMGRNRFDDISRALHFNDNSKVARSEKNRFIKLENLLPKILSLFKEAVKPNEYMSVDDEMMPFKGRLSFRQYNPKKRGRFGIKSVCLMDCSTKFLLDLIPYQGKSTELSNKEKLKELGYGGAFVYQIISDYLKKGHKVVIDNYFTSPKLAKTLKTEETYILGTVRKNRQNMPKSFTKLKKGEVETFANGEMLIQRWNDRREVMMINSFTGHNMVNSVSANPTNNREKPNTVLIYNTSMGTLDDMDKIIRPYQALRKSFRWYRKFAFHLIDIVIYNTFALLRHARPDWRMSYREYLLALISEILGQCKKPESSRRGRPVQLQISDERLIGIHFPEKIVDATSGHAKMSNCYYCNLLGLRKKTGIRCKTCNKRFCIGPGVSCFEKYHTVRVLPKARAPSSHAEEEKGDF